MGSAWDYMKTRGAGSRRRFSSKNQAAVQWDFAASAKDPSAPIPTMADTIVSEPRAKELAAMGYVNFRRGTSLAVASRQLGVALDDPMSMRHDVPTLDANFEWFPAWFLALWTFSSDAHKRFVLGSVDPAFQEAVNRIRVDLEEQALLLAEFELSFPYHECITAVHASLERLRPRK